MPRPKLSDPKNPNGILSVNQIAEMLNLCAPTIRRAIDNNKFPGSYTIPGTRERRVPAPGVLAYLTINSLPIPKSLQPFLEAYRKNFQT